MMLSKCMPDSARTVRAPMCRAPPPCVCFPLRARLWRGLHC